LKPSEIIEKHESLIGGKYFEFVDEAKTCRTCAVGALIQALPDEVFERMVKQVSNAASIIGQEKIVIDTLVESYNIEVQELATIQNVNDKSKNKEGFTFMDDEESSKKRREDVLTFLKENNLLHGIFFCGTF
jgi:hypothetical protein